MCKFAFFIVTLITSFPEYFFLPLALLAIWIWNEEIFCFIIFRPIRKIAEGDCQLCRVGTSDRVEQLVSHWTDFHEI